MTTIAFDGKTLAADTQISQKLFKSYAHKIFLLPNGIVCAGAGDWGLLNRLRDLLAQGKKLTGVLTKKQLSEVDMLYLKEGQCYELNASYMGYMPCTCTPVAIGSGSEIAWAFMVAGMSAKKAIEATSKVRSCTNNVIDVYDFKRKAFSLANFPE